METRSRPRLSRRQTNLALLVLVPLAALTGLFSNTIGTRWAIAPAAIHGVVAFAVLVVMPWKSIVIRRGLSQQRLSMLVSIALFATVLVTFATGVAHVIGHRADIVGISIMQIHVAGGIVAVVLVIAHYRSHPIRVRRADLDRRAFLRTAAVGGAAAAAWFATEGTVRAVGWAGAERRFTGSHEVSPLDPKGVPVTQWLDDSVQQIDPSTWSLALPNGTLGFDDLAAFPLERFEATLDCTGGWHSPQIWTGVRLDQLLDPGDRRSIDVTSATGYGRRFPARDLDRLWLATHMGDEPLTAGHGSPARLVAPDRRGFWWVKWVVAIHPSDVPWWIQLPFPAT
ncbi:MAG: molybdopterin-dependent oxidoreductase [Acidimicrobiia bacterium]|nr:molybdopterin-dependent oxidoreductase [Acidimicrobiia bacterium]